MRNAARLGGTRLRMDMRLFHKVDLTLLGRVLLLLRSFYCARAACVCMIGTATMLPRYTTNGCYTLFHVWFFSELAWLPVNPFDGILLLWYKPQLSVSPHNAHDSFRTNTHPFCWVENPTFLTAGRNHIIWALIRYRERKRVKDAPEWRIPFQ